MTVTKQRGRPRKNKPLQQENGQQKSYDRATKTAHKIPHKRVYVCSPFRGDLLRNIENARDYCRFAYDAGFVPIAPHLYFPQFLDECDLDERAAGMRYGLEQLWQCREVWVFGESITVGMRAEIDLAKDLKIPVRYFDENCVEEEARER
jgi:hypothetical protein